METGSLVDSSPSTQPIAKSTKNTSSGLYPKNFNNPSNPDFKDLSQGAQTERGARIKLDRADLNTYFAFGGFGCDAEPREELFRAGAERGASRIGRPLSECELIVIGNTTRDIDAAHAVGGKCLAVGTGGMTREDGERAGANWYVDDLNEAPPLLASLFA